MTTKMEEKACFSLSVYGLLNDVTFHMAKCCAEVNIARVWRGFIAYSSVKVIISNLG